ncbi:hypothetical protein ZYGR_0AL00870 [Zygosaccharomyces rouxii]|uniref:Thioesterase domain-containing protein n=1 Tax=Zygosaccharomyces rouxii TaxID=4956 RepID=A0A1Q3AFF7_ZYGRO|nr:hypothetical protein ZYGR_0AL00870 [Zygosaccharomyces rouxii]
MLFKTINRVLILPLTGFTLGTASFLRVWPDAIDDYDEPMRTNPELLRKWRRTKLYQELKHLTQWRQSERIPPAHRRNHVGQGLLSGVGKLENDPLVFHDEVQNSISIVYQLGKQLGDSQGYVNNGVLSILLDEALCYCGFPLLPSKRGVTARLDLDFVGKIPVDSTVVLKARVVEHKGRKCVISGTLESVPGMEKSWWGRLMSVWGVECYARAKCVLVEPKWFKWLPEGV